MDVVTKRRSLFERMQVFSVIVFCFFVRLFAHFFKKQVSEKEWIKTRRMTNKEKKHVFGNPKQISKGAGTECKDYDK